MFTDIVGYTALMGKDSAKALELIRISKEIRKLEESGEIPICLDRIELY